MNILLDERVPNRLKQHFPKHRVRTVVDEGWRSLKNGDLLQQAQSQFDVFLTVDQNVQFQQNLRQYDIVVIVVVVYRNNLSSIIPFLPQIEEAIKTIESMQLVVIQ